MASTWIWRGSYDRMEKVESSGKSFFASGERRGQPLAARHWSDVLAGDAVIAWSEARSIERSRFSGVWILNANGSVASRMTEEEKDRVWRRAGLRGGRPLEHVRLYRVSIVHLEPIELERIDAHGKVVQPSLHAGAGVAAVKSRKAVERGVSLNLQDPALRKVVRSAVQALYALGLDIGEAEVELGGDGRTAIRAAWPNLRDARLERAALMRFAAWHAEAAEGASDQRSLLIGADPEFVLVTEQGKVAAASRFFGAGASGSAGADAVLVRRRLLYPVAELRPEPADNPAALAVNLRRLMLRAASRISDPGLRWAAGAMPVPGLALGGHIHLSGAPLTSRLLRLLDCCAAFPLALVEDPAGRARRPRYGTLGDYRLQPHGGFEYRTLPSWLISPAAAKAALALALLCAREAMNLPDTPALDERYVEAYYAGDRETLSGCLEEVASSLSATASYKELAPYIDPLLDAARRGCTWDEGTDIRLKWQIPHV